MRQLLILNRSSRLAQADFEKMVQTIQDGLDNFFTPRWGIPAKLTPATERADMPGRPDLHEAIHVLDDEGHAQLLGFHQLRNDGIPEGFVFVDQEPLTKPELCLTLDHEVKEQLVNPFARDASLVKMPHWWGSRAGQTGLVMKEVCDPVQEDFFEVNGLRLANFVTPEWFSEIIPPLPPDYDLLEGLAGPLTFSHGGYYLVSFELDRWQEFGERMRRKHAYSRKARMMQGR